MTQPETIVWHSIDEKPSKDGGYLITKKDGDTAIDSWSNGRWFWSHYYGDEHIAWAELPKGLK